MARKKVKEPRTFEKPRMYYQRCDSLQGFERIRIVYPNGKCEFMYTVSINGEADGFIASCFAVEERRVSTSTFDYRMVKLFKTGRQVLARMREYDENHEWSKAEFICEL